MPFPQVASVWKENIDFSLLLDGIALKHSFPCYIYLFYTYQKPERRKNCFKIAQVVFPLI